MSNNDQPNKSTWIVEKKVNLGDILTMMIMFTGMLVFVGTGWMYLNNRIDTNAERIAIHNVRITALHDEMRRDRQDLKSALMDLRLEIRRLGDKIDQKQDK